MSYLPKKQKQQCSKLFRDNQPTLQNPSTQRTSPQQYNQNIEIQNNVSVIQYKNAVYYGRLSSNRSQQKHGIGIVLYDNGDILIADFSQDNVKGFFFYFQSSFKTKGKVFENGDDRGVCYYGAVDGYRFQLDGAFNIYHRNDVNVQVNFYDGKMEKNWFCSNKGNIITYQNILQGDLLITQQSGELTPRGISYNRKRSTLQVPPSPRKKISHKFQKPTDFLIAHLAKNPPQKSEILLTNRQFEYIQTEFQLYQIGNNQTFYGIIEPISKKPHGYGIIFLNQWPVCYGKFINGELNGLARVQQNKRLVLDGIFQCSRLKIGWVLDLEDNLTCYGNLIGNKQQQNFQHSNGNKSIFQYKQQYADIHISKIQKFRRRNHIQSLTYVNSYTLQFLPKIKCQILPDQLAQHKSQHMNTNREIQKSVTKKGKDKHKYKDNQQNEYNIIYPQGQQNNYNTQNFIPSFISQISRINGATPRSQLYQVNNSSSERNIAQSSNHANQNGNVPVKTNKRVHDTKQYQSNKVERDLIDLIKQYNQNKSSFQKVSKIVSSRLKSVERDQSTHKSLSQQKNRPKNKSINQDKVKSKANNINHDQDHRRNEQKDQNYDNSRLAERYSNNHNQNQQYYNKYRQNNTGSKQINNTSNNDRVVTNSARVKIHSPQHNKDINGNNGTEKKNGRIQNINKIGYSSGIHPNGHNGKQKNKTIVKNSDSPQRESNTQRVQTKKLNLQQIYNKYLKKLQ